MGFLADSFFTLLESAPALAASLAYLSLMPVLHVLGDLWVCQAGFTVLSEHGMPELDLDRARFQPVKKPLTVMYSWVRRKLSHRRRPSSPAGAHCSPSSFSLSTAQQWWEMSGWPVRRTEASTWQ